MPEQPIRYRFRKEEKLKSRKLIDSLFRSGKSFSNFPLKVIWLPENKSAVLQAGVGVSSRLFKKASDRNRIKRLMREAWRLQKGSLKDHLEQTGKTVSVFFLYSSKEILPFEVIYERMGSAIKRLIQWNHEKAERTS